MAQFLISFDDGSMDHIRDEDFPEVGAASHAVVQEAIDAGVWVYGAGLHRQRASVVGADGTVVDGPFPETKAVVGGFSVIDVGSREEALAWAAKIAVACRCAQEVREIMLDPESERMLREAGR
ncbi:YciI family protein [Actinoplanes sp. NPDC049802]|uniref:YciI family protein n=1 Tax=Actinoplanes sp. NPDC049802 TaxID=3154742 RepID=UPI0033C12560